MNPWNTGFRATAVSRLQHVQANNRVSNVRKELEGERNGYKDERKGRSSFVLLSPSNHHIFLISKV